MGKNRYLLLCLFLLLAKVTYSQEVKNDLFYKGANVKRTVVRYDESTFVCDTLDNITICIYNKEDEYWGMEQRVVGDNKFTESMILGSDKFVTPTSGQWKHLHNIVDDAFSKEMVELLNGELLLVSIDIYSSDGTVMGVGFIFDKGSSYESIPISVYKSIEDEIKSSFMFNITDKGRVMNYNTITWLQCPKGRENGGTVLEDGERLTMPDGKLDGSIGSLGDVAVQP